MNYAKPCIYCMDVVLSILFSWITLTLENKDYPSVVGSEWRFSAFQRTLHSEHVFNKAFNVDTIDKVITILIQNIVLHMTSY